MNIFFMRTTISIPVSPAEAKKTRAMARRRGFQTLSEYIRFLLAEDDVDLISSEEILKRSEQAKHLYRRGKLQNLDTLLAKDL